MPTVIPRATMKTCKSVHLKKFSFSKQKLKAFVYLKEGGKEGRQKQKTEEAANNKMIDLI